MLTLLAIIGASHTLFSIFMYYRNSNDSFTVTSLRAYNTFLEFSDKALAQSKKTGIAILNSFTNNTQLYFYHDTVSRIPHVYPSLQAAQQFANPLWVYCPELKQLRSLTCTSDKYKHVPFLSADIINSSMTYSLSTCFEKLQVFKANSTNVPLTVYILAWAYETNTPLPLFSNDCLWKLNVITEDGEEKVYNILTSLEIDTLQESLTTASATASSASSASTSTASSSATATATASEVLAVQDLRSST